MRIAEVNSYFTPDTVGGTEVFVENLARTLVDHGHTVEVFCTAEQPGNGEVDGMRVHRFPNHNLYWTPSAGSPSTLSKLAWHLRDIHNPRAAHELVQALRRFDPDIIHLHGLAGISPAIYPAVQRTLPDTPVVQTLHDLWLACIKYTMLDGHGRPCARRCAPCWARSEYIASRLNGIDRFAVPSEFLARYLVSAGLIPAERVQVVRSGVLPPPANPGAIRIHRQQRKQAEVVALFLGQLVPHKGVHTLLRALPIASSEGSVVLQVAGSGPLEPKVRAAKGVEFLGQISGSEKTAALMRADLLVVPSECLENSPTVILEAMQHGLAVIATRVGGIPELVRDGVNGRLVPPGDAAALGVRLAEAASSREQLLAWQVESLEAASEFTVGRAAERYLTLFGDVLSARSPKP